MDVAMIGPVISFSSAVAAFAPKLLIGFAIVAGIVLTVQVAFVLTTWLSRGSSGRSGRGRW